MAAEKTNNFNEAFYTSAGNTDEADEKPFIYDKEHLYDALASSTEDYVFVGNMKTGIFRYPAAMVREFGLPGEIVGNAAAFWGGIIHPDDKKGFLESNQEIADGRTDSHNIEYRARNVRGEWIWLRCRGHMIKDAQGSPELFAGMITNLGKNSRTDHMTGLYNRFEFEGNVKKYMVDYPELKQLQVIILDMDAFKNINDLFDRAFGDEVLRITARKISALLPSNARLYRLDGDEFGIIILNGEEDEYQQIFSGIRKEFHGQQEYKGKKYYCTVSGGYAVFPADADNYLDLLKCANYSLEHSKLEGKNRITRFSGDILREKERKLELAETYLIKEDAGTRETLENLKNMGIKLAMDDFGTGYSSLFSLKNTPVDIVKIDRGFVKGITSDLFNATFVRAITELCNDVGKMVCLEGVETRAEYDVVRNTGLELIQGFYFGKPVRPELFEEQWLWRQ